METLDEKGDLNSQSIGVRHEAKDGKNNEAGKQRCDLIIKTHPQDEVRKRDDLEKYRKSEVYQKSTQIN